MNFTIFDHGLLKDLINQSADKNNYEVIVANDRSTDKTKKIIDQFSSENSFIKSIHIEKKHSMTPKKYALTKAIENSKLFLEWISSEMN